MILPKPPRYQTNDMFWFHDTEGNMKYGIVTKIGGIFDEDGVRYYYVVSVDAGDVEEIHTVPETDIPEIALRIQTPRYQVGESIRFTWKDDKKQMHMDDGLIERVEIHICEDNHVDVIYVIDEESEFWVYETEVLGFSKELLGGSEDKDEPKVVPV